MGAEKIWANRRGEVRIFCSPANIREVRVCVPGEIWDEVSFIHTYHSEPEERTSLEIRGENMPPRRKRVLKTKFIHWTLRSCGRQRDQNLLPSSVRKCSPRLLFSELLLLTHPVTVLFLGWRGDPSPLPTQGTVQTYKAHLNQNTEEWIAGSSDKTWYLILKNQHEWNKKALPISSLKFGLHLAANNGYLIIVA